MRELVLVSGGLDSTIMALQKKDAIRLFVDYGQNYKAEEERAIKEIFGEYEKIKVDTATQFEDIFIPNRNLTLASLAATYYNPDVIYMAGLKDDYVVDKTPEAFKKMSIVISEFSKKKIDVISPYWDMTKGEVVEEYLKKGGESEILRKTYSCYNGIRNGCNDCPACFRRFAALESNGIHMPKPTWRITEEYLKKIHKYDSNRIARTLAALNNYYEIHAIDIDGVLCEDQGPYRNRKPKKENIQKLNAIEGIIILFTARFESDRVDTEEWLKTNSVHYHSLIMEKIPYSSFVDDKAKTVI